MRAENATKINEDFSKMIPEWVSITKHMTLAFFHTKNGIKYKNTSRLRWRNSKAWYTLDRSMGLNGLIMIFQVQVFVLLAFGSYCFWPRVIGSSLTCCSAWCCNLPIILVLWSARLNPAGELCSHNLAPSSYNGDAGGIISSENYCKKKYSYKNYRCIELIDELKEDDFRRLDNDSEID